MKTPAGRYCISVGEGQLKIEKLADKTVVQADFVVKLK